MNPNSNPLDRLLRSAASSPAREIEAPDWGSEARALASWRAALAHPEEINLLPLPMLRRALALAVMTAAVVFIGVTYQKVDGGRDPLEVSDAAISSAVINLALR